jgi:O-antigen ligase
LAQIPSRQLQRTAPGVAFGAFLVGLATTLYLSLTEWQGIALRPVHLVPVALLPLSLIVPHTFVRSHRFSIAMPALLWSAYMILRFMFLPPRDPLTAMRAVTCLATFAAAMEFSIGQQRPRGLIAGLLAGCLASILVAALDITILDTEPRYYGSGRWTGWMPGPNRFADLCGLVAVASLAIVIQSRNGPTRLFWALGLIASGGGLLASGSRGGLVATAAASLATVYFASKAQNRRFRPLAHLKSIVLLCLLGGVSLYLFGGQTSERVLEFVTLSSDGRTNVEDDPRRDIAAAAVDKFRASPLIGGGTENLALNDGDLSSHNSYLYLLSTSGLLGFCLFGAFVAVLSLRLWRIVREPAIPLDLKFMATPALAGILFLLVHMLVIDLVLSAHVWAFFGFATAAAVHCPMPRPILARRMRVVRCA